MSALPDEWQEQWGRYLELEWFGQRKLALTLLHTFIPGLLRLESSQRDDWAVKVVGEALQAGSHLPIRFPLFQKVVLPAFSSRVVAQEAGAAQQLAALVAMVGPPQEWPANVPPGLQSTRGLLEEALRLDPDDLPARTQLIQELARFVASTLHELPSGVLYESDGATLAQCQLLLEELDYLERLAEQRPGIRVDQSMVTSARLHYQAYGEYLQTGTPDETYQHFLTARAPLPSES